MFLTSHRFYPKISFSLTTPLFPHHTDIGANPSAEDAEEAVEDGGKTVIDVVDNFRLNLLEGGFPTKKDFQLQFKKYLKSVVEKLKESGKDEEAIKKFQNGVQKYYSDKIAPNFKDFDFYAGESMDPDGM